MPGQVQPMVVSRDKRYLYVGVRPEFRVLAYRIALDDGALTFAAESALPGSPTHISTHHQGQFVFVGSYNAGNVSVTRLEDGLPVGVVDVVEGLDGCHSANISPDNRTLWVPALKQDRICLFTVSDDGHLVAQDPAEVTTVEGAGPRHMVFHPNEQYAYCVNELNSSVDVWELKDLARQNPTRPDAGYDAGKLLPTPVGRLIFILPRMVVTYMPVTEPPA